MDDKMFCYQCQETANGTGCVLKGVCGKQPQTSEYMDLLLAVVRGVAVVDSELRKTGKTTC
ncbi:MAG: hydroxylamine reductase, partial [Prevotella sp.]|nr:hydroxylamine reductase [Prevotella sp.]MBP7098626.1 hydroxylamine reductase [Prevotella sp.]